MLFRFFPLTRCTSQPVDINATPKYQLREDRVAGTTDTWRAWAEAHEVEEWVQSVGGCLAQGWNEQLAQQQGVRHYEFPTGYNTFFTGPERCAVGEQFFAHSQQLIVCSFPGNSRISLLTIPVGVQPKPPQNSALTYHVVHWPLRS